MRLQAAFAESETAVGLGAESCGRLLSPLTIPERMDVRTEQIRREGNTKKQGW